MSLYLVRITIVEALKTYPTPDNLSFDVVLESPSEAEASESFHNTLSKFQELYPNHDSHGELFKVGSLLSASGRRGDRPTYDQVAKKVMNTFSAALDNLANNIQCPECNEIVGPPFYNLGDKHNSFEGCKECANKRTVFYDLYWS